MKLIDKFLIKIFLLTTCLLIIVLLDYFKVLNIDNIKNEMNKNINYIQIAKKVDGKLNIIDWGDDVIKVSLNDFNTYEKDGVNYYNSNEQKVFNMELGSVVKIEKSNGLYSVSVLSKSNLLYTYSNLKQIDVNMYSIVKCNDQLGLASKDVSGYTYGIKVYNED